MRRWIGLQERKKLEEENRSLNNRRERDEINYVNRGLEDARKRMIGKKLGKTVEKTDKLTKQQTLEKAGTKAADAKVCKIRNGGERKKEEEKLGEMGRNSTRERGTQDPWNVIGRLVQSAASLFVLHVLCFLLYNGHYNSNELDYYRSE